MTIPEMTAAMKKYFKDCKDGAVSKTVKYRERPIASDGGLCLALGITKDELRAMEKGTDEERKFYSDYLLEYEVAVDVLCAARLIPDTLYKQLKESFRAGSVEDDRNIILSFPDFNAPDDWEDYKALAAVLDENGLTWKQGVAIIGRYVAGGAKC